MPEKKTDDELLREFASMLRIDEHALDDALKHQPDTFYRVSRRLALVISQRDQAKSELAEVEADVERALRRDADTAGDKITVAEINAAVRVDKAVKAAQARLHALNLAVGKWAALKEAFVQRSYAIKDLVGLSLANYYTDTSINSTERNQKEVQARNARVALNAKRRGL